MASTSNLYDWDNALIKPQKTQRSYAQVLKDRPTQTTGDFNDKSLAGSDIEIIDKPEDDVQSLMDFSEVESLISIDSCSWPTAESISSDGRSAMKRPINKKLNVSVSGLKDPQNSALIDILTVSQTSGVRRELEGSKTKSQASPRTTKYKPLHITIPEEEPVQDADWDDRASHAFSGSLKHSNRSQRYKALGPLHLRRKAEQNPEKKLRRQ
jgi:hypothetical protein